MGAKSYKELDIWKKGVEIVNQIYGLTSHFPKEELYGITTQMRRSAVSIPTNIAEGFVRYHNKEYRQFLYVALGSCAELETQIIVSLNQKYLSKKDSEELSEQLDHESRMLMNMIKAVSRFLNRC
jgi:four helix bundle protein